jgi:hypothetical protein
LPLPPRPLLLNFYLILHLLLLNFYLILHLLLLNFYLILHLLLLKEKECNELIYSCIAPLLKERGWGEVKKKGEGLG